MKSCLRNLKRHWCKVVRTSERRPFVKWGSSGRSGGDLQSGLSWFKRVYREVRPSNIVLYSSAVFTNEKLHTRDKHWLKFHRMLFNIKKANTRGHGKTTLQCFFFPSLEAQISQTRCFDLTARHRRNDWILNGFIALSVITRPRGHTLFLATQVPT